MTRNMTTQETGTVPCAMASMRAALPEGWFARWQQREQPGSAIANEAELTAPDGQAVTFAVPTISVSRLPAPRAASHARQAGLALGLPMRPGG